MDVDEFSSLAAPYAASDPATLRYFDGLIRRAHAPIVFADAGPVKGKAIYAAAELKRAARIWTETPFVAMQHEDNKREGVSCCQCCFLPLLYDYGGQWRDAVTRWNAHARQAASAKPGTGSTGREDATPRVSADSDPASPEPPATDVGVDALDEALRRLEVSPRGCGLAGPAVQCVCGDLYCSRECQARAFHESHALLCPRGDPCSAMGAFLQHMQHTNDIFLLVAKVIARVLSRYLVLRDVVKARAPIDMFYKKPWWEVVLEETDGEHDDGHVDDGHAGDGHTGDDTSSMVDDDMQGKSPGRRPPKRVDEASAAKSGVASAASSHTRCSQECQEPSDRAPSASPNDVTMQALSSEARDESEPRGGDASASPSARKKASGSSVTSQSPQYLQEVLSLTHQLLLEALESNLVRLERENQLCGVAVDEIWHACSSVLSFEFFAALIGMFEMNNISMEIDHPFHALIDFFDPDMPADVPHPTLTQADRALVAQVRRVLQWEEGERLKQRRAVQGDEGERAEAAADDDATGFLGIEGTALFPIMCTMNHSCDPNCTVLYTRNGEGHVVATRDIQPTEELCICYIDIDMDLDARERNLREYKFTCHCSRCTCEREALAKANQQQQQQQQQGHSHGSSGKR